MKNLLVAAIISVAATAAVAQSGPVIVRGEVASYAPDALKVVSRSGETLDIAVPEKLQVVSILPRKLSDVEPGASVSATAVPGEGGKLRALQVSILPPELAGKNEGQRPSDLAPDSVMTNAVVTGVTTAVGAEGLSMKYGDKTVEMTVPADTPVMMFGQGDKNQLTRGASVFIVAMPGADGKLSTDRVIAETNGFKPPM